MDNEKEAEIIPFPEEKIVRNEPHYPTLKHVTPIVACLNESFKSAIDVAEGHLLSLVKLNITGEIEITTGDKKYTKEVDFVVEIDIDGLENDHS